MRVIEKSWVREETHHVNQPEENGQRTPPSKKEESITMFRTTSGGEMESSGIPLRKKGWRSRGRKSGL